jgi:hypothetical protein
MLRDAYHHGCADNEGLCAHFPGQRHRAWFRNKRLSTLRRHAQFAASGGRLLASGRCCTRVAELRARMIQGCRAGSRADRVVRGPSWKAPRTRRFLEGNRRTLFSACESFGNSTECTECKPDLTIVQTSSKYRSAAAYKLYKLEPWCVKTEPLNRELSVFTHLGTSFNSL